MGKFKEKKHPVSSKYFSVKLRVPGTFAYSKFLLLFILLFSVEPSDAVSPSIFFLYSPASLIVASSGNFLNPLLYIPGALTIICVIIIYISVRLRRTVRALKKQNKELEGINLKLQRTNIELTNQKENKSKEHFESDKFLGMLIQAADDGISFYDRDWSVRFANPAFYSVIGYDSATYNLINSEALIHPDDSGYHAERLESLKSNGYFESELRLMHKDGHYVNLSTKSVTVKDDYGEIIGSLTISRDITKIKNILEELVKANNEAESSSRLKSNFLANISHEIRTPLNSVVGFSNLLLTDGLAKEVREEYIEHINHNSEKLLQIIGDIIDLSRLESSQIEITYEEASVNSIVNEVIEEARQVIRRNEKSIILNIKNQFEESTDLIFTDRIWLRRVLTHLMDNAVKFTLNGSIEFSYYVEDKDLMFKIRDTGIGINKENLGRIFEEFRQEIDGHHRPFEGLGIGLTLAKEVIERMGGKIYVESEKGIGSVFSFAIPYRPAGSSRTRLNALIKDQLISPVDWSSKKCLLVDDNKDVLIYLNRILLDTGIIILASRSGPEAVDLVRKNPDIDVILLDMQMPEMNGIEATKEIRKIMKDVPIIAQTAFIFEDDKDIILEAGCDACLIKPIRKDQLLTVMSTFIKQN